MNVDRNAPRLNSEQARALDVVGASVALSAGAGCGKTTVLTERFLLAIQEGRATAGLVALTFTDKAARELRQRIRQACYDRLASDTEKPSFWREILRTLEAAPIGTFHEYCGILIRGNALKAGVDPDFEVLDAAIAGTVREEALARQVRRWLAEENVDLIELAVEFGLPRVRQGLAGLIQGRHSAEIAAWAERSPEDLIALWKQNWETHGRAAAYRSVDRVATNCREWLRIQRFESDKLIRLQAELIDALGDLGPDPTAAALSAVRESAQVPRLKIQQWPSSECNEDCKKLFKSLREAIDKYSERCIVDEPTTLRAAEQGLRFARLATVARGAYDAAKHARGGLDFDDLLTVARDLLRRADVEPPNGVRFVLVDEFQDTDPVQAEVLRRIAGADFARGKLFVVGDFKQSIYRFRGAEPRLFQDIRAEFPPDGQHELSRNYRSSPGVIDFVNALFADAFPGESARLLPGSDSAPTTEQPAVEFLWADEPSAVEEGAKPKKPTVEERRRTEACWIARHLRARIAEGWLIRDRAKTQVRKAHAGDVAILFRAMTDLAAYEQALEAEGFDYHVVGGKAFYAQQEVRDLVNVLSIIEDPMDPVALAGALRGPFFALSDEALYWLHQAGREVLIDGLDALETATSLDESDRRRALRARTLFNAWRDLKDRVPIAALVDRVLDESGFEAALVGESLGGRKRANARKLVRLARRFDARGGFTLAHFVARLRADLQEMPREEQAATTEEEGESIRLMSIHQSKGLEFPIVVVPDLNRKSDNARAGVAFSTTLGPLVRPASDEASEIEVEGSKARSLGWQTFEALERQEDEEEALRLFYVATTRARDALILSAGARGDEKPESPALRLLAERFNRDDGSCLANLPNEWNHPRVHVIRTAPPAELQPGEDFDEELGVTRVVYLPGQPAPNGTGRRARLMPRFAASAIEATPLRNDLPCPIVPARSPRYVDLDAQRGLSTHGERLDRLIRSIVSDRNLFTNHDLARTARRAARQQVPLAHEGLIDEAVALLEPWLRDPRFADLSTTAAPDRVVSWSRAESMPDGRTTIFRGTTELFRRAGDGSWCVVTLALPESAHAAEQLRIRLSSRVAPALGFGPVASGWIVSLGAKLEVVSEFDDAAIAHWLQQMLAN